MRGRIVTPPPRHQKTCLNEHVSERLRLSFIQNSARLKGMRLCPYQILDVFVVPVLKTVMLFLRPHRPSTYSRHCLFLYRSFIGNMKGKMQIGRPRLGWKNQNKLISKRVKNVDRNCLYQGTAQQLARLNIVMNFKSSTKFMNLLTSWANSN